MGKLMAVMAALAAGLALAADDAGWDAVLDGSVRPTEAKPPWRLRLGNKTGKGTEDSIEDGAIRIADLSREGGTTRYFCREWQSSHKHRTVIEFRARCVRRTDVAAMMVLFADGRREETLELFPDHIALFHGKLQAPLDPPNAMHDFRIEAGGNDVRVLVDGKLAIDGKGLFTRDAHSGRNLVGFGSNCSRATGEGLFDSFRYRTRGPALRVWPGARHIVVAKDKSRYYAWPNIVRLRNGDILVSFHDHDAAHGNTHTDYTSDGLFVRSADGGATWSKPQPVHAGPHGEENVALYQHTDGSLWANMYSWQGLKKEEAAKRRPSIGLRKRSQQGFDYAFLVSTFFVRSSDGGRTWSNKPEPIPLLGALCWACNRPPIRLRDGTLLLPVYGQMEGETRCIVAVYRSKDGVKWGEPSYVRPPEGDRAAFYEPVLRELPDGRVLCAIRTSGAGDHTYLATSRDAGRTWACRRTEIVGHPADLTLLPDGRLVCTYGYRHNPYGVRAAISADGGATWDIHNEIILRMDGLGGDLGYPSTLALDGGELLTVYYFYDKAGTRFIAGTFWQPPAAPPK